MSDDADLTDRHTEIIAKANLYKSRRDEPVAVATGKCLYCGAPLPSAMLRASPLVPDQRWCDAECRDEWESL